MLIYHYDTDQVYVGQSTADESPLEPGVFLIPANATATSVPSYTDGQRAVWNGSFWDIEDIPEPVEETPVEEVPENEDPWTTLRRIRNIKLADTDYLALSDRILSAEMITYRQTLRDLPANTTDPANPIWPTKP